MKNIPLKPPTAFLAKPQKAMLALAASGLALLAAPTMAQQEVARVISSTPVMTQVAVPRQVCSNQQVTTPGQKSGVGGIMGAIAGGAIGSNLGGGDGRLIASAVGLIGGAMLGDKLEGAGASQTQNVQSCTTQSFYETRTTAYNVVYEFGGKQYTVQMPQDPGPTLRLQITPVPAGAATAPVPQSFNPMMSSQEPVAVVQPQTITQVVQQPVYVTQQPVYVGPPVVVAAAPMVYYTRPYYYPPVGVSLNIGGGYYRGWGHGHGHGHWR